MSLFKSPFTTYRQPSQPSSTNITSDLLVTRGKGNCLSQVEMRYSQKKLIKHALL